MKRYQNFQVIIFIAVTLILFSMPLYAAQGLPDETVSIEPIIFDPSPGSSTDYSFADGICVIDFDATGAGTTFTGDSSLNLGSGRSVTIKGTAGGQAQVADVTGTSSEPNLLMNVTVDEFGYYYGTLRISFNNFYCSSISLNTGLLFPNGGGSITAVVTAFRQVMGEVITTEMLSLGSAPTPVNHLISIADSTTPIGAVELYFRDSTGTFETLNPAVLDDLTLTLWEDAIPEPAPDLSPPVLDVTDPNHGHTVSSPWTWVCGTVQDDQGPVYVLVESTSSFSGLAGEPVTLGPETMTLVSTSPNNYYFGTRLDLRPETGTHRLRITTSDMGGNTDSESLNVVYTEPAPPEPAYPLSLNFTGDGIEINQGVQDFEKSGYHPQYGYNSTTIITDKTTLARVYASVDGIDDPVPDVNCRLRAFRGETELIDSPLYATDAVTLTPDEPWQEQRTDPAKTFNFILPDTWLEPGDIRLIATVNPGNNPLEDQFDALNDAICEVEIMDTGDYFYLNVYKVRSVNQGGVVPTTTECIDNIATMRQIYPVPDSKFIMSFEGTVETRRTLAMTEDGQTELGHFAHAFRRGLGLYYGQSYNLWPNTIFLALTDDTVTHPGVTTGYRPVSVSVASDEHFYRIKTSHECGHALGLGHVEGCGDPASPYEDYPRYADDYGSMLPIASIGGWGVEFTGAGSFSLKDPATFRDLMSYCVDVRWMSNYSHDWLAGKFDAYSPSMPAMAKQVTEPTADRVFRAEETISYYAVNGTMDPKGIQLDPIWTSSHESGFSDNFGKGQCEIVLADAKGTPLFTRDFEPETMHDVSSVSFFSEMIPVQKGTVSVTVNCKGKTAFVKPGNSPPTVSLLNPKGGEGWSPLGTEIVSFKANDPDGDSLVYTIFYSNDSGKTWQVALADLTEEGAGILLDNLPGGKATCLIRVQASDGLHQGEAISGSFSKGLLAPAVEIIEPRPLKAFHQDDTLVFQCVAYDREDLVINRENIRWVSDKDGLIGYGQTVRHIGLSTGLHTITVTATDSDGYTATDRTGILVYAAPSEASRPCNPVPTSIDYLNLTTTEQISNAPVRLTPNPPLSEDAATFSCNIPEFCSPVNLYIVYRSPENVYYYVNSEGELVTSFSVYKTDSLGGFFDVFDPGAWEINPGTWQVSWVVLPSGGDWTAYWLFNYTTTLPAPGCEELPDTFEDHLLVSQQEIADAAVTLSLAADQSQAPSGMILVDAFVNFPGFCSPADLYIVLVSPDGQVYYAADSGMIGPSFSVYKTDTMGGISEQLMTGQASFKSGTWQVLWIVKPTGNDWTGYALYHYWTTL